MGFDKVVLMGGLCGGEVVLFIVLVYLERVVVVVFGVFVNIVNSVCCFDVMIYFYVWMLDGEFLFIFGLIEGMDFEFLFGV